MIIRHLSIDCAYINKVLEPITQREHGVTEFEIEAKNHGADIDLSECTLAIYYGLKPDEHKVGVECRVDKDKDLIYLPLYLQMTTAEGVLKGIVELQFPEGNVRFSGVNFKVSFAPDDTKIESTDDFNILENFISKPTTNGVVGQVLSIDNDGNTIWRTLKEFDGDYAHLSNRPSINGVELNGDKSLEDLNIKQTYTADDIPFADGETFQQKFNNGELKGQDGVSGADGITPHIGDNGNWFIGETDTNKPSQGTNGVNGNDGVGVTKSEVNTSGELVITYSNGDSINLGKIVGKDGLDGTNGQNGLSAYEIAKNGGFIGTEEDWLKSLKGEQGEKGQNGADGKTPVKGTDYFTAEDKTEFTAEITDSLKPELAKKANKSDIDSINSRLQSTETTLENKANIADMSNSLAKKADKSTTLAGYGITDAYTQEETNKKLAQKLNSMPFDSEPKNNSPCYLTSGTVYNALLTKPDSNSVYSKTETDNLLGEKANATDVTAVEKALKATEEDLTDLTDEYYAKIYHTWEKGGLNTSNGSTWGDNSPIRCRTTNIPIGNHTIKGSLDYTYVILYYNPTGFIGASLEQNGEYNLDSLGFYKSASYYKIHAYRVDNGNVDISNIPIYSIDNDNKISAKVDNNENDIRKAETEIDNRMTYEDSSFSKLHSKNLIGSDTGVFLSN